MEDTPAPLMEDTFALLRRYREGDGEALEQIFARHYPRVERIVRVRLGTALSRRLDGADIVQTVMLRALKEIGEFEMREDARLIHWLARIAEREIASRYQHEHAQKRDLRQEVDPAPAPGEASDGDVQPEWASESTLAPERAERREMVAIVDECLAELPAELREVILLREYAGGSWEFVAEELGRPSSGAARQLYLRARDALSERVRRRV